MAKIMLVIDNSSEQKFLAAFIGKLSFDVVSLPKGGDVSTQLIDQFPDVVFASTLGKNTRILSALGKIKQARGKPKVVFVRPEKETAPLNTDQKNVVDGILYSPIDPFKLLDVLSLVTEVPVNDLRELYRQMMLKDKSGVAVSEGKTIQSEELQGNIHLRGMGKKEVASQDMGSFARVKKRNGVLLIDPQRKKKYEDICARATYKKEDMPKFDSQKLRELQKKQADSISDDPKAVEHKKLKDHFLKTLFLMGPKNENDEE